jgi:hypothetical protein
LRACDEAEHHGREYIVEKAIHFMAARKAVEREGNELGVAYFFQLGSNS